MLGYRLILELIFAHSVWNPVKHHPFPKHIWKSMVRITSLCKVLHTCNFRRLRSQSIGTPGRSHKTGKVLESRGSLDRPAIKEFARRVLLLIFCGEPKLSELLLQELTGLTGTSLDAIVEALVSLQKEMSAWGVAAPEDGWKTWALAFKNAKKDAKEALQEEGTSPKDTSPRSSCPQRWPGLFWVVASSVIAKCLGITEFDARICMGQKTTLSNISSSVLAWGDLAERACCKFYEWWPTFFVMQILHTIYIEDISSPPGETKSVPILHHWL